MSTFGLTTSRLRRPAVVAVGAVTVSVMAAVGPTSVSVVAFASNPSTASTTAVTATTAVTSSMSVATSLASVNLSAGQASGLNASGAIRRTAVVAPAVTPATRPAMVAPYRFATRAYNKWWARTIMVRKYGWTSAAQFAALVKLWNHESNWNMHAHNRSSGAHGIPQAMPGSKMRTAGSDWRTNPVTQIRWGLTYIHHRYGTPAKAWAHFRSHGWY